MGNPNPAGANGATTLETAPTGSTKSETQLLGDQAIPLLLIYPQEMKMDIPTKTRTLVLTEEVFIEAKEGTSAAIGG